MASIPDLPPGAGTTLVVLLGAGTYPRKPAWTNPVLEVSARGFRDYVLSSTGLAVPVHQVLDLFDDEGPAARQCEAVEAFLRDPASRSARDLIVYYVGHGGFDAEDYYLAVRDTANHREFLTAIESRKLARIILESFGRRRVYVILDSCFAASAASDWQGSVLELAVKRMSRPLPRHGTAFLAAASKDDVALAPRSGTYTMFTGALLRSLQRGISGGAERLSLYELYERIRDTLNEHAGADGARPELHAPRQNDGDISLLPLFPNPGHRPGMIGQVIKDFKIIDRLGKGGMGEVWLAEQQIVKTRVAIKVLLSDLSRDQQLVQRFLNEAIAVSKVRHAGIVRINDVGFHRGSAFLIMELLEGETLAARIRRAGALPIEQVGDIGRQIASVLEATHAADITHRDLKPDNIFLVPDAELASGERVKVLDFGIAKLGTAAGLTAAGGFMGTPGYMAPEQWTDAASVDARADVYAVGCIVFEMCCGRPPFVVSSLPEAYARHAHETAPRARALVGDVPVELDDAIAASLAKQPSERPSLRDLQHVLARVAAVSPVRGPTPAHADDSIAIHQREPPAVPVAQAPPTMPVHRAAPVAPTNTTFQGAASSMQPAPPRRWRPVEIASLAVVGLVVAAIALAPSKIDLQKACDGGEMQACYQRALAYEHGTGVTVDATQAAVLYLKACDAGHIASCLNLGILYDKGAGVAADPARAAGLYRQACDGGELDGCFHLGVDHASGIGVAKDLSRAAALYEKACDGGPVLACSHLGSLYAAGTGVAADATRSAVLYRKACDGGELGGCYQLGVLHEHGTGVARDLITAAALQQKACDGGWMESCSQLGALYDKGSGVAHRAVTAAALYEKACDGGAMTGCLKLAVDYETGTGVLPDARVAATLHQKACDGGEVDSCFRLGVLYNDGPGAHGTGIDYDMARASALYRKACDGGMAHACFRLGDLHFWGRSVPLDRDTAATLYRKACDGGWVEACFELGFLYDTGNGIAANPAKAVKPYQKACDGGQGKACYFLGSLYNGGKGVVLDATKAAALYQKACDGDELSGCFALGVDYQNGVGVTADLARAAVLYQKACDGGDLSGCFGLGCLYDNGTGLGADRAKAAALYQKACDGGYMAACNNLGVEYRYGSGITADAARAATLYQKACEGGNMKSCANLAELYQQGTGVVRDRARAAALRRKACEGGEKRACTAAR